MNGRQLLTFSQDHSDSESGSEEAEEDGDEDEDDGEDEDTLAVDASQLSFGALARAQASMNSSSRRQRGANANNDSPSSQKAGTGIKEKPGKKPEKPPHRTSKHAPAEMSSKRPVSRKRDFLTVTAATQKQPPRDPRFMPLGPGSVASTVAEIKARKAYAFLDEYRESEMQQLRAAAKKTKSAAERERLQKALMSMESRRKAQARKDKERAVIEEHRRQEKELIKQGKKPFYLKRSEQKKRVLVDQFQGMKKGQVDKAIERRRKKMAAREKKLLPVARRGAEDR